MISTRRLAPTVTAPLAAVIMGLMSLALPALAAAQAGGEQAPPPSRPGPGAPSITVQGTAEVRSDPDVASVRLGIVAQGTNAQAAQERANQAANAILAAVRGLGVPAADVQTTDLSLTPLFPNDPRGTNEAPRIVGYQATDTVAVRLERLELVGKVIDAGLTAGANRVDGVDFGLRDEGPAEARALAQAVAQARQKAQAIAGALGVRLGEALAAEEGGGGGEPVPRFAPRMAVMASAKSTPISAGQIATTATVTVRYRIAP